MKILAVSQFYTPDITAAAFRISETVSHLRNFGEEVEVITTYPHKINCNPDLIVDQPYVHRVRLSQSEDSGLISYLFVYLSFLVKSIFLGLQVGRKQSPDVIWASSPPIFVGISGWILAKILNAKLALDIRDIWPDSAVAAGQISKDGISYKVGQVIENFLYSNADIITCVANPMKQYIQNKTGVQVYTVYNGVEVEAYKSSKELNYNKLAVHLTDKDSRKILYAGNFGHVQQLDILIDAYADLDPKLQKKWEIYFVGGGTKEQDLKKKVHKYDLGTKIHFIGSVSKSEVFKYLRSADVLFIHLMESGILELTIPSKVFDYMLVNKPLIVGIEGEGREIVDSVVGNVSFPPGSKEKLIKSISEIDEKFSGYSKIVENDKYIKKHFTRKSQSKKLYKLLKQFS